MYRILIVCTGNTCRSPMLETMIKAKIKKLGKKLEVKSVGLYVTDDKINQYARNALKPYALVIRHKPTQLATQALERADSVLTMTDEQKYKLYTDKCFYKVFSMREAVGFNIPDPYGMGDYEYSECAKLLDVASDIIIENLLKAGKI